MIVSVLKMGWLLQRPRIIIILVWRNNVSAEALNLRASPILNFEGGSSNSDRETTILVDE